MGIVSTVFAIILFRPKGLNKQEKFMCIFGILGGFITGLLFIIDCFRQLYIDINKL